jgi:2-phospho-L-lactate guanylyltransferase
MDGTNALYINPIGSFEFAYGAGSFAKHRTNATKTKARVEICDNSAIGLDLDLPEDLEAVGGLSGLKVKTAI